MRHYLRIWMFVFASLLSLYVNGQSQQWQNLHKVRRGETLFGIAKNYNITIQQLLDANPEMKAEGYELKKGAWIAVPFGLKGDKLRSDVQPSQRPSGKSPAQNTAQVTGTPSTKKQAATIHVGVMLPLHNEDGDGIRMVEYYRGLLLALNQLESEGINTDVHAWNVPKNADIRTTLLDKSASSLDIIFGPLYTAQAKPLADFCRRYGIKLVIPFSIESREVEKNPNVFQVYQADSVLNAMAVSCFLERYQNTHRTIFINCNDPDSRAGKFTRLLRQQLDACKTPYELTNVNSSLTDFAKHFSSKQPNAIVLNTERSPQLTRVFHKLDSLTATRPGLAVSMFGYNEWFIYQDYDLNWFFKYNIYIPSTFFYNKMSDKTRSLETLYQKTYGQPMDRNYIPRLALTGYDQGEFFVRGLSQYGKGFKGLETQPIQYRPLQTRLRFVTIPNGGQQNKQFQLIHFKSDQTMESLTY